MLTPLWIKVHPGAVAIHKVVTRAPGVPFNLEDIQANVCIPGLRWLDHAGSARARRSRETEILKRGASNSATDVRIDDQFECSNA